MTHETIYMIHFLFEHVLLLLPLLYRMLCNQLQGHGQWSIVFYTIILKLHSSPSHVLIHHHLVWLTWQIVGFSFLLEHGYSTMVSQKYNKAPPVHCPAGNCRKNVESTLSMLNLHLFNVCNVNIPQTRLISTS